MVTVRDLQYFVTFCDLISSHGWDSPDALTLDGARVLPFAAMALRVNLVTPAGWHDMFWAVPILSLSRVLFASCNEHI